MKFDNYRDKDRMMLLILFLHLPVIFFYSLLTDHLHVNLITLLAYLVPLLIFLWKPGSLLSRMSIAVSMVIFSATLIHLSHGLIEMHFHIFVVLVILSLYNDWKIFSLAALGVALHHLIGLVTPLYEVYAPNPNLGIYGLHILFVGLECIFLAFQIQSHKQKIELISQQRQSLITTTRRLLAATESLNSTAGQQASGSERQVSATSEVLATLQELNTTVEYIADRLGQIDQAMHQVLSASQHVKRITKEVSNQGDVGVQTTEQVIALNEGVNTFYVQLLTTLGELEEQSEQIVEIIETISSISDQINLLGLNAMIEAAGAGKQGVRFSVVAKEMQKLADHSLTSNEQISIKLIEVKSQIQAAVISATSGQRQIGNAVMLTRKNGIIMNELSEDIHRNVDETARIETLVDQVNQSTKEISVATRQLHFAFAQVVEATQEISLVAKETADGSYDINSTAQHLEAISSHLKLSFFNEDQLPQAVSLT